MTPCPLVVPDHRNPISAGKVQKTRIIYANRWTSERQEEEEDKQDKQTDSADNMSGEIPDNVIWGIPVKHLAPGRTEDVQVQEGAKNGP